MAKTKFKTRSGSRPSRVRSMNVRVTVRRTGGANPGVEACVYAKRYRGNHLYSCEVAKNPRKAVEKAMKIAAKTIGGRSGAFAGLK